MILMPEDRRLFEQLSDADVKSVVMELLSEEQDIDQLSPIAKVVCMVISDKNNRMSKRQSASGSKGGAPAGNRNALKQPKTTDETTKTTKTTKTTDETTKTTKTTQRAKKQPKQATVTDTVTDNTPDMLTHITPLGVSASPFDIALKDFSDMRKKTKSPLTERAVTLLLNELERLAPNDEGLKIKILEQSVMHGWKGVFPLKESSGTNTGGSVSDGRYGDGTPTCNSDAMPGFVNALDEFDEGECKYDTG